MIGRIGIALLGGVVAQQADGAAVETYVFSHAVSIARSSPGTWPHYFEFPRAACTSEGFRCDMRIERGTATTGTGSSGIVGVNYYKVEEGVLAGDMGFPVRNGRLVAMAAGGGDGTAYELHGWPFENATVQVRGLNVETLVNGTKSSWVIDAWTEERSTLRNVIVGQSSQRAYDFVLMEYICNTERICLRPLTAVGSAKQAIIEILTQDLREI